MTASPMPDPRHHNRLAWDRRAELGETFTRPIREDELRPENLCIDPWAATEGVAGKQLLCLAAGGGRQGPLYAAAGAIVTVVDISDRQLDLDRRIAAERGLSIRTLCASMDDLSALPAVSFDIVIHPVSTCYLPQVAPVYRQVAAVTRPDGLYVSQHKQPASLQAEVKPSKRGYEITETADHPGPLPAVSHSRHREPGTLEFLHTWEQLIGGLCRAGFVIEDLTEPRHGDRAAKPGEFGHRSRFLPPYVRIKARRLHTTQAAADSPMIIQP